MSTLLDGQRRLKCAEPALRWSLGSPQSGSFRLPDCTDFDQSPPYGLPTHAHALRDSSYRDTAEVEPHRFSSFLDSQAGLPSSDAPSGQMRRNRGAMHAVLLGELGHRRTCQVVADESIDLGGREKGLKILNPPDNGTARVLDRGGLSAL